MNSKHFQEIALSLREVKQDLHVGKISFKVKGKIFATLNSEMQRATLKLSLKDQDLFGLHDSKAVFPVPNKWGRMGWTHIDFNHVKQAVIRDILLAAYMEVAPKKLVEQLLNDEGLM